jgi:hypothetical protein
MTTNLDIIQTRPLYDSIITIFTNNDKNSILLLRKMVQNQLCNNNVFKIILIIIQLTI